MAAPSDPTRSLRVGSDADLASYDVRSHLSDGRVVAWTGPTTPPVAIDAEIERPVPPALVARHGVEDFWERWTRLECVAKLTGTPMAMLTGDGLAVPTGLEITLHTLRLHSAGATVVVSVAQARDGVIHPTVRPVPSGRPSA